MSEPRILTPEEVEDDAKSYGPDSGSFDLSWWRYIVSLRAAWAERDAAEAKVRELAETMQQTDLAALRVEAERDAMREVVEAARRYYELNEGVTLDTVDRIATDLGNALARLDQETKV